MTMYKTIDECEFVKGFDECGRSNQFSVEARRALFKYYMDMEDIDGIKCEYDPIAICCDWVEYPDEESMLNDYQLITDIEHMKDSTTVIDLPSGGYVIAAF